MAKKALQGEKMKFEIDKKAFSGPFKCHGVKTKLVSKNMSIEGNLFSYSVWQCPKCRKEFLDSSQAKKLEDIWTIEKLLKDDVLIMRRSLNFDGKMFFLRFPKEITKKWKKDGYADIKVVDSKRFVVEING